MSVFATPCQSSSVPLSLRSTLRLYHCHSVPIFACTIVTPCQSSSVQLSLRASLRLCHCHSVTVFVCTIVAPCQSSPVPLSLRSSLRLYHCHSVTVLACTSVTPCSLRLYQCHSMQCSAALHGHSVWRCLRPQNPYSDTRIFISLFIYLILAISVLPDELSRFKSGSGHRLLWLFLGFSHYLQAFSWLLPQTSRTASSHSPPSLSLQIVSFVMFWVTVSVVKVVSIITSIYT